MESGTTIYSPEPEAVEVIFARILSTAFAGASRPTYRFLKLPGILRVESHPIRSWWPNWASYPHWHIDAFGGALKSWHLPLVEPIVVGAAAVGNSGKGDCECQ